MFCRVFCEVMARIFFFQGRFGEVRLVHFFSRAGTCRVARVFLSFLMLHAPIMTSRTFLFEL